MFPYSAQIFRTSIFLVAPSTAESVIKKKKKKKKKKKWRRLPAVHRLRAIGSYREYAIAIEAGDSLT